ncbi:DNA-3-methyladenine glycosylase family protein [Propylenella binzhouense]|uniref:DNA-3-methyladenine glycosylase II n=1 Tax=Propylenella binzhouense TaxID=2555902 RepID=A0A964WS02_9HYPH|nr:DNA-3-methyladenine glycosylase [Propylenella binzhouense]MYZ46447.1 DNA-3-methyladenine glycosylase 2 family protein [Propylenella binzhouense]
MLRTLEGAGAPPARLVRTLDDVDAGLAHLTASDPRLAAVLETAGEVPLRRRAGGFEGLAAIITAQQISDAAADAIWRRVSALVAPFTPEGFLAADPEALKGAGLSRPKVRTLTAISAACRDGFDLDALEAMPAEEAVAAMVVHPGIGRWTAEIYLLFCLGHPDIFPAGDLALQNAVCDAFGLDNRPNEKALRAIAEPWSPWRGVAARLFWSYYRARRQRPLRVVPDLP